MKATMRKLPLAALAALLLVALVAAPALAERYGYWGVARKPDGTVISGASVSVYTDAALTTAATVYDAYTGGSSSATPPQASSNAYGQFAFWVDTSDYSPEQLFYIKVTSGSYTYTLYQVSIVQAGYLFSGGVLSVPGGGTGASSLTDHGVLVGSGTGAVTPLAVGTDNQILVGNTGADPSWATNLTLPGWLNLSSNTLYGSSADNGDLDLRATSSGVYGGSLIEFTTGGEVGQVYISGNTINAYLDEESDSVGLRINQYGHGASTGYYRDFSIYDGKNNVLSYWDGSAARLTHSVDVLWGDGKIAKFGNDSDMEIAHSGAAGSITNVTGLLYLRGPYISITNAAGTEKMATFDDDGAVSLYYDNQISLATVGAGYITLGAEDSIEGVIKLFSDGTLSQQGGKIIFNVAPDYDTTIANFTIQAYEDDFWFGPSTDIDALKYSGGSNSWLVGVPFKIEQGELEVGKSDTTTGHIAVYGNAAASTAGGDIGLYTAADYDGTINKYLFSVVEDDLQIGPSTDTDAFKYDGGSNWWEFTTTVKFSNNLGLGTGTHGTGATNAITLRDGAVPGTFPWAGIAAELGEVKVWDTSGNVTTISPHGELDRFTAFYAANPKAVPWTYTSQNPYTGKLQIINMGALVAAVEALTGKSFTVTEDVAKRDWATDQATIKAKIEADRKAARTAKVNELVAQRQAAEAASLMAASQAAREVEIANRAAELQVTHGDTVPVPMGEEGEPVLMTPRQAAEREIAPALTKQEALAQVDVDAIRAQAEAEIPAIKPYQVKQPPAWLAQRIAAMEASK